MFVIPLIEIGVNAWPYRVHDPNWRIGLVTTFAGASAGILLALLIAYSVGLFAEDRLTLWLVAIVSGLMVLVCLVGSGAFVLDALQMRAQVRPGLEARYNLGSAWGLAKVFLVALGAVALSASAFRTARALRRAYDRRGKKVPAVLVSSSTPVVDGPTS
jgi:hypothetical protein